MAKFAKMQMFHLVAIFATNAILKLKRQYPGSVVPLAMFSYSGSTSACIVYLRDSTTGLRWMNRKRVAAQKEETWLAGDDSFVKFRAAAKARCVCF